MYTFAQKQSFVQKEKIIYHRSVPHALFICIFNLPEISRRESGRTREVVWSIAILRCISPFHILLRGNLISSLTSTD